jgi:hypothetical protein
MPAVNAVVRARTDGTKWAVHNSIYFMFPNCKNTRFFAWLCCAFCTVLGEDVRLDDWWRLNQGRFCCRSWRPGQRARVTKLIWCQLFVRTARTRVRHSLFSESRIPLTHIAAISGDDCGTDTHIGGVDVSGAHDVHRPNDLPAIHRAIAFVTDSAIVESQSSDTLASTGSSFATVQQTHGTRRSVHRARDQCECRLLAVRHTVCGKQTHPPICPANMCV